LLIILFQTTSRLSRFGSRTTTPLFIEIGSGGGDLDGDDIKGEEEEEEEDRTDDNEGGGEDDDEREDVDSDKGSAEGLRVYFIRQQCTVLLFGSSTIYINFST